MEIDDMWNDEEDLAPYQDVFAPYGCLRCNTPRKCSIWGCTPNTFPAETETDKQPKE